MLTEGCEQCSDDCGCPPGRWECSACGKLYCDDCIDDHLCRCDNCGARADNNGLCVGCEGALEWG